MARSARSSSSASRGIRGTIAGGAPRPSRPTARRPTRSSASRSSLGFPSHATIKVVSSAARRVARAPHHPRRGPRLGSSRWRTPRGRGGLPPAGARDGKAERWERLSGNGRGARRRAVAERAERARRRRGPTASQGIGRDRGPPPDSRPERDEAGGGRAGRAAFAAGDLRGRGNRGVGREPDPRPEAAIAAIPAASARGASSPRRRSPWRRGPPARAARSSPARSLGTKGARRDGEDNGSSRWLRARTSRLRRPKDPYNNIILTDNARIRLMSRRFDTPLTPTTTCSWLE